MCDTFVSRCATDVPSRLSASTSFLFCVTVTVQAQSSNAPSPVSAVPPSLAISGGAFTNVTVIDVVDGRLLPGQTVVVVGSRVQSVGATGLVVVPRGAYVVDAPGKYLMPGLWDMHVHPKNRPQLFYPLLTANGVTGIRDAGTPVPLDTLLEWRRDITAGRRVGPRQIVAGPSIPGYYAGPTPATAAEGRRLVDSIKTSGADFIKVRTLRSLEVYFAMAAEAKRLGIPIGGHLPRRGEAADSEMTGRLDPLEASDSGISIIDHRNLLSEICTDTADSVAACQADAARLRRNGTWLLLTMIPSKRSPQEAGPIESDSSSYTYRASRRVGLMHRSGIPFLLGTDAAFSYRVMPGASLHEELALHVWAGLTPLAALQAATLNPARYLHGTDSLGTIASGKLADLVLLDANPLVDIHNTMKIRAFMANGRYFDRAALDALVESVRTQVPSKWHLPTVGTMTQLGAGLSSPSVWRGSKVGFLLFLNNWVSIYAF